MSLMAGQRVRIRPDLSMSMHGHFSCGLNEYMVELKGKIATITEVWDACRKCHIDIDRNKCTWMEKMFVPVNIKKVVCVL